MEGSKTLISGGDRVPSIVFEMGEKCTYNHSIKLLNCGACGVNRIVFRNEASSSWVMVKYVCVPDMLTWMANPDRGAELSYSPDDLKKFNIEAIELIASVQEEKGDLPTVLCDQIGPRGDGVQPCDLMSTEEAESYHTEQIKVYSNTEADMVSASTICYAEEAAGVERAAHRYDMPLKEAIEEAKSAY